MGKQIKQFYNIIFLQIFIFFSITMPLASAGSVSDISAGKDQSSVLSPKIIIPADMIHNEFIRQMELHEQQARIDFDSDILAHDLNAAYLGQGNHDQMKRQLITEKIEAIRGLSLNAQAEFIDDIFQLNQELFVDFIALSIDIRGKDFVEDLITALINKQNFIASKNDAGILTLGSSSPRRKLLIETKSDQAWKEIRIAASDLPEISSTLSSKKAAFMTIAIVKAIGILQKNGEGVILTADSSFYDPVSGKNLGKPQGNIPEEQRRDAWEKIIALASQKHPFVTGLVAVNRRTGEVGIKNTIAYLKLAGLEQPIPLDVLKRLQSYKQQLNGKLFGDVIDPITQEKKYIQVSKALNVVELRELMTVGEYFKQYSSNPNIDESRGKAGGINVAEEDVFLLSEITTESGSVESARENIIGLPMKETNDLLRAVTTIKMPAPQWLTKLHPQAAGAPVFVGMIHVPPIHGTASPYLGLYSREQLIDRCVKEARIFKELGIDTIMIENMGDTPYFVRDNVPAQVTAIMSVIAYRIRKEIGFSGGVQILAGANKQALAVAYAAGFRFIRAEAFTHEHVADEGMIGKDNELIEYKQKIKAQDVFITTDLKKKHSYHPDNALIQELVAEASKEGADAVIFTGQETGEPTDLSQIAEANEALFKQAIGTMAIAIGSGIITEQLGNIVAAGVHMLIVGTSLKPDEGKGIFKGRERWRNPIDPVNTWKIFKELKTLRQEKYDITADDAEKLKDVYQDYGSFQKDHSPVLGIDEVFRKGNVALGTLNLPALPGNRENRLSPDEIIEYSIKESEKLIRKGARVILLRNPYDDPITEVKDFLNPNRDPMSIAIFSIVANRITRELGCYVGIEIKENPLASVAAAYAGGGHFIVSQGIAFSEKQKQTGVIFQEAAAKVMQYRNLLNDVEAPILIFSRIGARETECNFGASNEAIIHGSEFMEPDGFIVPQGTSYQSEDFFVIQEKSDTTDETRLIAEKTSWDAIKGSSAFRFINQSI